MENYSTHLPFETRRNFPMAFISGLTMIVFSLISIEFCLVNTTFFQFTPPKLNNPSLLKIVQGKYLMK